MLVVKSRAPLLRIAGQVLRLYACFGFVHALAKVLGRMMKARRMWKQMESVPRARYTPFLGGVGLEFLKNRHRLHDWRHDTTNGLPVSKVRATAIDPDITYVVVRDPACIRHVLKNNFDNYTKPSADRFPILHFLNMWLGNGIFVAQHGTLSRDCGRSWLKQRKIASNIFSRANFNSGMQAAFAGKAKQLVEMLKAPAASGTRVDMQQHFFNFTMDSIMEIFFGEPADTLGGQENKYGNAFDAAHRSLMGYVLTCTPVLTSLRLLPWPLGSQSGLAWKLHHALHPKMREFRAAYGVLDFESRRLLVACRADPRIAERRDLLALFVQAEEGERFSPEFLRDVILNFVIAGRDTTACTLAWMFYVLATHPEVQRRAQEEVDRRFPASSAETPTFKSLSASEMPYLNGLLYETLRLYPPVPLNVKEAAADDKLPNGMPVPRHLKVFYQPYSMGRDPQLYPEPEEVRPERWIPFKPPPPHEFPVFQAGPRICLGMDMAVFEVKLLACELLRHFWFDLAAGEAEKITYSSTITMSVCNSLAQDSHNLWLVPSLRQH